MASGFPFSPVPWYTTNAAKFVGNVSLGPVGIAGTPNCSLQCNCKARLEALTDRSKWAASSYLESDDSSGAEVRRCCDPSSSTAAAYPLEGDLAKCSNSSDTGTLLGSAFKASNSCGPCIRCEEQRPGLDANITSRQNPPNSGVHNLNGGRTRPKSGSESKTRNPTRKLSMAFKPCSVGDAYYPKMQSKSSKDLKAGYLRAKNTEPEVEIYIKDLAAFSDSINETCHLQEGYVSARGKHDNNKIEENGKVSKRKAGEMERKAMAVEVHPRNMHQESRIVRISRLTGGKDRHSKVLTAKGIRDRRIRLSVPTAIQFYDLQDRLGFEQPSKAVDWLIHTAKSAIDELPVQDAEMAASASAGNVTHLISSNSSRVQHCVASPSESVTAAAASAFRFGLPFLESEGTSSDKVINEKDISIMTMRDSELGRSSSSTSDGSIKESVEHYTSNSSMSKPSSRIEARLKARERAKKKSASAKIYGRSPSAIRQLKSMERYLTNFPKGVLPYTTVPVDSQCIKDDNPCGIHTQDMSGIGRAQPLWDSNMPSYTGILFTTQNSHPLPNMATLGSSAIQNSFPPLPSTSDSIQTVIGSSLQSYEMADSVIPFSDPKRNRQLGWNAEQSQANLLYSNINLNIMQSVDQQQQQQSKTHILKNFASTIVPTLSKDISFSTSSLSSQGSLQSNSSASITNMPYFPDSEECLWEGRSIVTATLPTSRSFY